jgi:glycosyltransferase involved in cell wall biosynthesis
VNKNSDAIRVLIEMRPAFDGFSGIPQETRLFFKIIAESDELQAHGLIQGHKQFIKTVNNTTSNKKQMDAWYVSELAVNIQLARQSPKLSTKFFSGYKFASNTGALLLHGLRVRLVKLQTVGFSDYIYSILFGNTLEPSFRKFIDSCEFHYCEMSYKYLHNVSQVINKLRLNRHLKIQLNTENFDFFVAQTPFPATVSDNTRLIIRYHDAIPIYYPHTISDVSNHQKSHALALKNNVKDGAYFVCVSESTRQTLIQLLPEVQDHTHVIYNSIPPVYRVRDIPIQAALDIIKALCLRQIEGTLNHQFELSNYFIVVGTIEPRKNYTLVLRAWDKLQRQCQTNAKLILVSKIGWGVDELNSEIKFWKQQGSLIFLSNVEAEKLSILFQHALATICPSFEEGFDFPALESLSSGGVVWASDIPVHNELLAEHAQYFDPYSEEQLFDLMHSRIEGTDTEDTGVKAVNNSNKIKALAHVLKFREDAIKCKWEAFFKHASQEKSVQAIKD